MTLTVEDGSGVVGADSYVDSDYADTYHDNRQNTAWAALSDDDKEAFLRKANDYMRGAYRTRWKGQRLNGLQAMDWPRANVPIPDSPYSFTQYVAQNVVPDEVRWAQCELALSNITGDLAPNLERATLSEAVGPIQTTYDHSSPEYTRYRKVDMILSVWLRTSGAMAGLVRV